MARPLSLLFLLPFGMENWSDRTSEMQLMKVASNFVGAVGVLPGVSEGRNRGVPTGSARSWSDGIGTVWTEEVVGAGIAAVDRVGRGREIRGAVLAHRADVRGAPPDPKE